MKWPGLQQQRLQPRRLHKQKLQPQKSVRCGAPPPAERAGEVEERILDAARKVFLDRGFEGASIEEIADVARSGKPTIYARFRDKKALFTAAVTGYVIAKQGRFENYSPSGTTIGERLANIGVTVLQEALTAEWI